MTDLVRDGQARGVVRRDADAEFRAELAVSVIIGTITQWINDPAYPLLERMRRSATFLGEALQPARATTRQAGLARRPEKRNRRKPHANRTL